MADRYLQPGIGSEIQTYVARHTDESGNLLPALLARACAQVLHVADAGISMIDGRFRLPIGASSDMASFAESLQFTMGIGPCLEAASRGEPLAAPMTQIQLRWPELARELFASTPYEAILSLPLSLRSATGAIDLYFTDNASLRAVSFADALDAAAAVAGILGSDRAFMASLSADTEEPDGSFLGVEPARSRGRVWIAVGMLMSRSQEPAHDCLDRLRAYAYFRGGSLDDAAAALIDGTLDPAVILDAAGHD